MPSTGPEEWDLDPYVRQAHRDRGRSWIRVAVTIVASGFLFELVGVVEAVLWLVLLLAIEFAAAELRKRFRDGDMRLRAGYAPLLFANACCWVAHALLLWAQPQEIAKIAALFDLFTASLYAAVGGASSRRLTLALLVPPIIALPIIVISYVWTEWSGNVAIISTVATLGTCVVIVVNALMQNQSEHRVLQTAANLAEANRAKDAFLTDMSHEVRTPLNGVVALAGALERTTLDANQREMVTLIRSSGETMRRLVSGLLDLAKIDAGRMELSSAPFDVAACIEAAVLPMRPFAEGKGLSFSLDIQPSARGAFIGDSLRFGQIVANLISNAVKVTADGAIVVEVRGAPSAEGGVQFDVAIRDTGPGLSDEMRALLFRRFSQLDGEAIAESGTGLGLAISMAFARLMGGDITVTSTPGAGSEFVFRVQLARATDAEPSRSATAEAPRSSLRSKTVRILVVEDHAVSRRAMELILATTGAEIETVDNGRKAVEAFQAGRFDLVLMDKRMPELDGLSATREIRDIERARGLPASAILMLSADASQRDLEDAIAAGCSAHLPKPFTPEALFGAIDRIMTERETSS